ncbi:MAG: DUF4382 domain-containing protein [Candidatus Diapherotrites archaeon]
MNRKFGLIALLLVFSIVLFGCTQQPPGGIIPSGYGTLVLKITDANEMTIPGLTSLNVTISNIEVHKTEGGKWITFFQGEKTFDLMKLSNVQEIIGQSQLEAGHYTQIRFDVTKVEAVIDDNTFSVMVPGDKIKLVREFTIDENKTVTLVIDFSPASLKKAADKFIVKPVIKIESEKEHEDEQEQEQKDEEEHGKEIDFETIEKGYNSGYKTAENLVVKDNSAWQAAWSKVKEGVSPAPELPSVDFSKEMVIAVFMGEQSTGGYSIEIDDLREQGNSIRVFVEESSPGPDEVVTLALTQPYHIVRTYLTDKNIEFVVKTEKEDDDGEEEDDGKGDKDGKTEGYITPGFGDLKIYLKDSPKENDDGNNNSEDFTSLNITISKIEVHKTEGGKWFDFTDANYSATFDLMKLANVQELLGTKTLESGHYTQIRLSVDSATVGFDGNNTAEVKVPSDKIKLVHQFIIDANKETDLLLDFKPESVHKAGSQWIMSPVIKVITLKEPELPESECDEDSPCDANQLCCNDSCITPACTSNSQCDDSNSLTTDSCSNAGLCTAQCLHVYAGQLRTFDVNADTNAGFVPNSFSVSLNDTVKLNITSLDANHSIVIPDFNINTELPFNVTTAVQFVADKNGSFSFHCGVHPLMTGTITIS